MGFSRSSPRELYFSLLGWQLNCSGGEEGVGGNLLAWIKQDLSVPRTGSLAGKEIRLRRSGRVGSEQEVETRKRKYAIGCIGSLMGTCYSAVSILVPFSFISKLA